MNGRAALIFGAALSLSGSPLWSQTEPLEEDKGRGSWRTGPAREPAGSPVQVERCDDDEINQGSCEKAAFAALRRLAQSLSAEAAAAGDVKAKEFAPELEEPAVRPEGKGTRERPRLSSERPKTSPVDEERRMPAVRKEASGRQDSSGAQVEGKGSGGFGWRKSGEEESRRPAHEPEPDRFDDEGKGSRGASAGRFGKFAEDPRPLRPFRGDEGGREERR